MARSTASESKNGKTTYPEMNLIRNDIDALKSSTGKLLKHLSLDGQSQLDKASQIATEKLASCKEGCAEQTKKIEEGVKQRPLKSVAIAFGAGAVISYLLKRR